MGYSTILSLAAEASDATAGVRNTVFRRLEASEISSPPLDFFRVSNLPSADISTRLIRRRSFSRRATKRAGIAPRLFARPATALRSLIEIWSPPCRGGMPSELHSIATFSHGVLRSRAQNIVGAKFDRPAENGWRSFRLCWRRPFTPAWLPLMKGPVFDSAYSCIGQIFQTTCLSGQKFTYLGGSRGAFNLDSGCAGEARAWRKRNAHVVPARRVVSRD